MMDLTPIAQAILVYAVLTAGVLVTLLTGFAQLRELPRAFRSGQSAALVRRGFLAASVGMGSIGGSILALELGGPGAIGWMWVASLLGMALVYAEVLLAARHRRKVGDHTQAAGVYAMADGLPALRLRALDWLGTPELLSGRTLALAFALLFMVFAISAGSMLQTQQTSVLLEIVGAGRWTVVGFLVAAAAIGMLVPKLRAFVVALGPVAVALYVLATILLIARSPGDVGVAFAQMFSGFSSSSVAQVASGAAGGTVLMAMQAGFLRATLATEAGIGSAGFTPQADTAPLRLGRARALGGGEAQGPAPAEAAAAAMLAPLLSGIVIPTLTVLVTLTSTPWVGQRLDEPGERLAAPDQREAGESELVELAAIFSEGDLARLASGERKRVMALWAPLERPQSRGTSASLQAGQTLVLPLDAIAPETGGEGLLEGYVYPMVMRASPRGMKIALSKDNENSILLGYAEETAIIREVVFRDRNAERGLLTAYDLRIPVENRIYEANGRKFVRLTPTGDVDFKRMQKHRDGPYVVFGDFHFEARVVKMFQNDWGVHHALVEATPDPARPLNLRTAISSGGFRGPYFDNGEARPPLAMVAREDFAAPVGARIELEYRPPARGLAFGNLLSSGELMTPPWRFLADTKVAVIRHKTDPTQDMLIPVTSQLLEGTLRFVSGRKDIADFAKVERWRNYTGPYLLPPPYRFEVEVHTGARFPASSGFLSRLGLERSALAGPLSDRRTLVAVHPLGEPQGSKGELYDPHPAEVAPFMDGPWVVGEGLARVGWASRMTIEPGNQLLLSISVLLLALTTMIAWSGYGARAADFVFGRGGGLGFQIVFVLAGLTGATLTVLPIIRVADYAMLGLVVLNGLGLVLLLLRSRGESNATR
jgi:Na+/alanine symporter